MAERGLTITVLGCCQPSTPSTPHSVRAIRHVYLCGERLANRQEEAVFNHDARVRHSPRTSLFTLWIVSCLKPLLLVTHVWQEVRRIHDTAEYGRTVADVLLPNETILNQHLYQVTKSGEMFLLFHIRPPKPVANKSRDDGSGIVGVEPCTACGSP